MTLLSLMLLPDTEGCPSLTLQPRLLTVTTVTWWQPPSLTSSHSSVGTLRSTPLNFSLFLMMPSSSVAWGLRALLASPVWIADEPDPCQAASFSIFRSAQVLDAGGSFWRALPYLNTALFSSWHISWPKCICFLSDYWSPSSRMWVPWEPKPSAFLTGMSTPEPLMQWMAIKYLQNSWLIWKTVKYIQFSKMMTGTNYAGPSRVQESSLCMPISAAIFI